MKIWICIPVFNRVEYTLRCLASLQDQTYRDFCVVVCDHGSSDGTGEKIRACYPDIIVLHESPELWWTGATNRCVEYVMGVGDLKNDAVVTLNNDLEVDTDYLSALACAARRYPNAIITSAGYDILSRKLVAPGARRNWLTSRVSVIIPEQGISPNDAEVAEVTHAPGRGTLIPLHAFHELGLYDEQHLPHYGADFDYTYRASRAGYRILISYRARVYSHIEANGMTAMRHDFSFKAFVRYLTDMKSPANLSARWWIGVNNCPRLLLPSYLLLDVFFVVGSYFKFHIKRAITGSAHVRE